MDNARNCGLKYDVLMQRKNMKRVIILLYAFLFGMASLSPAHAACAQDSHQQHETQSEKDACEHTKKETSDEEQDENCDCNCHQKVHKKVDFKIYDASMQASNSFQISDKEFQQLSKKLDAPPPKS